MAHNKLLNKSQRQNCNNNNNNKNNNSGCSSSTQKKQQSVVLEQEELNNNNNNKDTMPLIEYGNKSPITSSATDTASNCASSPTAPTTFDQTPNKLVYKKVKLRSKFFFFFFLNFKVFDLKIKIDGIINRKNAR